MFLKVPYLARFQSHTINLPKNPIDLQKTAYCLQSVAKKLGFFHMFGEWEGGGGHRGKNTQLASGNTEVSVPFVTLHRADFQKLSTHFLTIGANKGSKGWTFWGNFWGVHTG